MKGDFSKQCLFIFTARILGHTLKQKGFRFDLISCNCLMASNIQQFAEFESLLEVLFDSLHAIVSLFVLTYKKCSLSRFASD